jgi:hypothetical protein
VLLGDRGSRWRCLLVWVSGSTTLGTVVLPVLPHAARVLTPSLATEPLDLALVDVSAGVVLACALWAWLALCATIAEAWCGVQSARRGPWRLPTGVRRLVLAACGVALVSGVATPAHADAGRPHRHPHGVAMLSGLPLPDRAVAPPQHRTSPPIRTVTVRPGDTLWSIARRELPATAPAPAVVARWHAIYQANRPLIGPDPDLIEPGQHLRIPRKDRP